MYYQVSQEFFDKLPNACFGAVAVRGLDNTHDIPELEQMLADNVAACETYFAGKKPKETEDILPYRAAFTALGINPNKFLCSIEALLTRIAKGKGFPHINAAVDLGMQVIGYDPFLKDASVLKPGVTVNNDLDQVFPLADYITVHVPLTPETRDMLDAQAFGMCKHGVRILNFSRGELVHTAALLEGHTCKLVTYGRDEKADYRETGYKLLRTHDFLGVAFHVTGKDEMDVKVNMPGEFSVYNALAALAVGKVLGLPDAAIHDGLGKCVVKGRVELVPISKKFTILLDYAHNEVSTESLLTTLRAYKPHRLVVVFGCGGNRSKLRRYGMGEICAKMADFSILTEDNNRFEKVEDIIADIREGMNKGNPDAKFVEIPDRLDALHYAVDHAQEGDLIAVIGKGHETYRDREGVKTPFLERELLEEYAQQIGLE